MNKLFVIIFFSLSISVVAQTNTWTGTTDGDWHKACNWSPASIPTCSDDVVIPTVGTTYPTITGIAHSKSVSITSAAAAALTINSTVGGILYIGSGGGSCAGTATDNGGCNCLNLQYLVYQIFDPGGTECDGGGGVCGTMCYIREQCDICHSPSLCISMDCFTLCGSDCGGWFVYEYAP